MSGFAIEHMVGGATAGESQYLLTPLLINPTRCIIWHHGAGGETYWLEPKNEPALTQHQRLMRALLNAGYAIYSGDFGTPASHRWGNDHNMGRLDAAWTYLTGRGFGSKLGLWGTSMGHLSLFNWAHRNIAKVACGVGTIGVTDADWTFNNLAGINVNMNAAYDGTGNNLPTGQWAGNKATRDPMLITGVAATVGTVPWKLYWSAGDTYVGGQTQADALAARLGVNAASIQSGSSGHADSGLSGIASSDFVAHFNSASWS